MFWDIYAWVYDLLVHFAPYRKLMEIVTRELNCNGGKVLDVGCGTGNLIYFLPEGTEYVGIDMSVSMLRRARKKFKNCFDFRQEDMMGLTFPDSSFDALISANSLYAAIDPQIVLNQMHRVLKPTGKIVIVVPPRNPKMVPLLKGHMRECGYVRTSFMVAGILIVGILNIFVQKMGEKGKFTFYTPDLLSEQLTRAGFEVKKLVHVYEGQGIMAVAHKKRS